MPLVGINAARYGLSESSEPARLHSKKSRSIRDEEQPQERRLLRFANKAISGVEISVPHKHLTRTPVQFIYEDGCRERKASVSIAGKLPGADITFSRTGRVMPCREFNKTKNVLESKSRSLQLLKVKDVYRYAAFSRC